MKIIDKIGVTELQYLVEYIYENKNSVDVLVGAFGVVASNNGYGTTFLKPNDSIFKVVWIHEKDDAVESVGLGGQGWDLKISDLFSLYKHVREDFERYENEYIYIFSQGGDNSHFIKIYSKDRVVEDGKLLVDKSLNGIEIHLL